MRTDLFAPAVVCEVARFRRMYEAAARRPETVAEARLEVRE